MIVKPTLTLPDPIRGSDPSSFAEDTMRKRIKHIVTVTLAENDFSAEITQALKTLYDDIPFAPIRALYERDAAWEEIIAPFEGENWLDVPWLFAEFYFYRRILEAVKYRELGIDPYHTQKWRGWHQTATQRSAIARQLNELLAEAAMNSVAGLALMLSLALWGNQADLSMFPDGEYQPDEANQANNTIVDETNAILNYLQANAPLERVDIVLDNGGLEQFSDLCLADYLLSAGLAHRVVVHDKPEPIFVSDVIEADFWMALELLQGSEDENLRQLGVRLQAHVNAGTLARQTDAFWALPYSFWQIPSELSAELNQSSLLISKGDANYRRWLGDRLWPYTTNIADIISYMPMPVVLVRTIKSELMAGVSAEKLADLQKNHPNWLTSGQYGVLQFINTSPD